MAFKKLCGLLFSGIIALVGEHLVSADAGQLHGPSVSLFEENDFFAGTDRHYTQGFEFDFLGAEKAADSNATAAALGRSLPNLGLKSEATRFGFGLGQLIYTPTDHSLPTVQSNDRPYAGFLYLAGTWQRRGEAHGGVPLLDNVGVKLGVVGPESMAEDAQNAVHRNPLQGWRNQLKSEPGFAVKYERLARFEVEHREAWAIDMIPWAGLSLGTIGTYGAVGGEVRSGYHLPQDFGVHTIDSILSASGGLTPGSPRWGFYLFTAVEGRAVAYNTFLDGSLFHESHHVDKYPLVGDFKLGLTVVLNRFFEIGYTQVFRSKEFIRQTSFDSFGAVLAKIQW